jgi:hypothetical protein
MVRVLLSLLARVSARRGGLLFVLLSLALLAACMRSMPPAEVEQKGTKEYAGQGGSKVMQATSVALKTLGYDVTLTDAGRGRVKTAPKLIQVTAVGSSYSATAISDSLAWTIDVSASSNGSVVHARPQAFRNGLPLDLSNVNAAYLDRSFDALFHEIEDNLPGYVPPAPPASASTSSAAAASSAKHSTFLGD